MAANGIHNKLTFDRASDWCNPILVKEVRQALKSRAFVTTFLMLLLGSWLISALGLLAAGPAVEYGRVGQYFFLFYFGALCIAVGAVVPYNAFRSLLTERDENTFELLSITALTPGEIVRGKWTCALVQTLLFYSAITPFIAFSSLLQGFDIVQAALLLVTALYASAGLSIATLMLSTTVRGRTWQGLVSMLVLSVLGGAMALTVSGLSSLMFVRLPIDRSEFWWSVAGGVLISLSYMWLFYQIASARLSFESENRATGIRVTAAGQLLLVWLMAALVTSIARVPYESEIVIALVGASGIHVALVGISVTVEVDGLSRRTRRELPRFVLVRSLMAPLLPGGALGYFYLLLILSLFLALSVYGWSWRFPDSAGLEPFRDLSRRISASIAGGASLKQDRELLLALAICCYIAIYCGFANCLLRWVRRFIRVFEPVHARTVIIILIATGMIIPMSLRIGQFVPFSESSVVDVLFPFWVFMEIVSGASLPSQFAVLLTTMCLTVGFNIPAIYAAVAETLAPPPPSSSRPHLVSDTSAPISGKPANTATP